MLRLQEREKKKDEQALIITYFSYNVTHTEGHASHKLAPTVTSIRNGIIVYCITEKNENAPFVNYFFFESRFQTEMRSLL